MPACPKPKHRRLKPKRGSQTKITAKVRQEVLRRSNSCCERCGRHSSWGMEMAHCLSAAKGGKGSEAYNVILLCGPSIQNGTCHFFADHTREGREWRMNKRDELIKYYELKGTNTR